MKALRSLRSRKLQKVEEPARSEPSEDDDISLMSASDMEDTPDRRPALRRPLGQPPTQWAEVDPLLLQRLAVSIAYNAMPANEVSEDMVRTSSRITVKSLTQEEEVVPIISDPLGLGPLDPMTFMLQNSGTQEVPELNKNMRRKLIPSTEAFDADTYLSVVHKATSVQELLGGLEHLRLELSEHTSALKALVKDNFERFISSKATVDDVYERLLKAEQGGVHGGSSEEVAATLAIVRNDAQKTFGQLLERQARAEEIKRMLEQLERYHSFFKLPSKLSALVESGDTGQVALEYKRAKAQLTESHIGCKDVWSKVIAELDRAAANVVYSLETCLQGHELGPADAFDIIQQLEQLRSCGVPSAGNSDGVRLYIEAQKGHTLYFLKVAHDQHVGATSTRSLAHKEDRYHPEMSNGLPLLRRSNPAAEEEQESVALHCIRTLTDIYLEWWVSYNQFQTVELPRLECAEAQDKARRAAEEVLNDFRKYVLHWLDQLSHQVSTHQSLVAVHVLAEAHTCVGNGVESLVEVAASLCARGVAASAIAAVKRLPHKETFKLHYLASHSSGIPRTETVAQVEGLLTSFGTKLIHLANTCSCVDGFDIYEHADIPGALYSLILAFINAVEEIGENYVNPAKSLSSTMSSSRKFLLLSSNMAAVKAELMPKVGVFGWCSEYNGGQGTQAHVMRCIDALQEEEVRLATAFIECWRAALDALAVELICITQQAPPPKYWWEEAPLPSAMRPAVLIVINNLVSAQAELAHAAPFLMVEALEELAAGFLERLALLMADGTLPAQTSLGGLCQLWMESLFFVGAFAGLQTDALASAKEALLSLLEERVGQALSYFDAQVLLEVEEWIEGKVTLDSLREAMESMSKEALEGARSNIRPLLLLLSNNEMTV